MKALLNVLAFVFGMFVVLAFFVSIVAVFALSTYFLGSYWGAIYLGVFPAIVITKLYVITVFMLWGKPPPDMEIRDGWDHRWHR